MTDEVIIYKMGWCFTCDDSDCQHVRDTTQNLIDALRRQDESESK